TPDYSLRSRELDSEESEELNSTEVADACASASSLGINLSANRGSKAGQQDRAEARLGSEWSFAATLPHNFRTLPAGAQVARFEQAFAEIGRDPERMNSRERETFAMWLGETAEAFWEEPHGQQAQRLQEEIMQW